MELISTCIESFSEELIAILVSPPLDNPRTQQSLKCRLEDGDHKSIVCNSYNSLKCSRQRKNSVRGGNEVVRLSTVLYVCEL